MSAGVAIALAAVGVAIGRHYRDKPERFPLNNIVRESLAWAKDLLTH